MSFDIKNIVQSTKRKTTVTINGFQGLITIIYGYQKISNETFLLWNVEGTNKTFHIEIGYVTREYGANYIKYFKDLLEQFRNDFLDWKSNDEELYNKYKTFDRFILPFKF